MKIQDMKLDLNAICEFEKLTGKTLNSIFKQDDIGMYDIRGLVQAGLKIETPEEAGNLIQDFLQDETQKETLLDIIERKIEETMPTKKKTKKSNSSKKK